MHKYNKRSHKEYLAYTSTINKYNQTDNSKQYVAIMN